MLPKVDKANMADTMKAIKEYFQSCCGVARAPLACIIRKIIAVQTYGDYPKYAIPENKIITRMLDLPLNKNKLQNEKSAQSSKNIQQSMR